MLMYRSFKRVAVLTATFTASVNATGFQSIYKGLEYEVFREDILERFPIEGRQVYNAYTKTQVPLIAPKTLEAASPFNPQYCPHARTFMSKHGHKRISKLQYGQDCVFALHATDKEGKAGIIKTDLRESVGDTAMCQEGVYLAKHTGICPNVYPDVENRSEYTTLRYGSKIGANSSCYFALVLVMNPRKYQAVTKSDHRELSEWLVVPKADVLVLKLYQIDTKIMKNELFEIETKKYLMRKTAMHKKYAPNKLKRVHLGLLSGRKRLR